MKLKPIALAIPMVLAAGSLSAAEIYNKDGNSVELSGAVNAFGNVLSTDATKAGEASQEVKEITIGTDKYKVVTEKPGAQEAVEKGFHVKTDASLSVKATHEIDEVSKVIGSFEVSAGDSTDTNASFGDIKFAYEHADLGTISLGETGNSFGAIEKAHAGEGDNLYAISQGGVDGKGIRYEKSVGDINVSANYETDADAEHKANYAVSAEYKQDQFTVAVAYGSDGDKATSTGIAGDVKFGDIKLGAAFVSFEDAGKIEVNDSTELALGAGTEGHSYALTAQYELSDVTLYASYQAAAGKLAKKDFDGTTIYAGADYKLTDAIKTYLVVQQGEWNHDAKSGDATNVKFGAKYSF